MSESHVSTTAHSGNVFVITTGAAEQSNRSSPTSHGTQHGAQAPLISIAATLHFPMPHCNDSSYEMSWPVHLHGTCSGSVGSMAREPQGAPGASRVVRVTPAASQKVTALAPIGWPGPRDIARPQARLVHLSAGAPCLQCCSTSTPASPDWHAGSTGSTSAHVNDGQVSARPQPNLSKISRRARRRTWQRLE